MMDDDPAKYINKGLLYNPDVAAVISYIKKVAVMVPWVLKQGDNIIESHDILKVWDNPNPMTQGKLLRGKWIEHYLCTGNGYIHGIGPMDGVNGGKIQQIWNLQYDLSIEKGTIDDPIKSYTTHDTKITYDAPSVLQWKTTDPDGDGYYGVSPLKAGRLVLQQSNDAYLANSKSLQNMGTQGILTRKDMEAAGPEKGKELKEKWKEEQTGPENFNKLTIAQGEYEYIKLGLSPVDMALLESQVKSRQAIANIYGFPSELLNDKEGSTYNNMIEKRKMLYTNIIVPLLTEMAEILHPWLVAPYGDYEFLPNWDNIPELQANMVERADWLGKTWWMTANEKRESMGLEEDLELDGYYIPANLIREEPVIDDLEALKQYR